MSSRPADTKPSRLQTVAMAMASGVFLLPIMLGKLFEMIIKAINPDGVTVSHELAYLQSRLVVSFSLVGVGLIITLVTIFTLQRREGAAVARPAWVVLGVQVVLGLLLLLVQGMVDNVSHPSS